MLRNVNESCISRREAKASQKQTHYIQADIDKQNVTLLIYKEK